MVKTGGTEPNELTAETEAPKTHRFKVSKAKFVLWTCLVVMVVFAVTNPQAVKRGYLYLEELHNRNSEQVREPDPIMVLMQQVEVLQRQLTEMQYKIDNQEPQTNKVLIDDANLAEMKDKIAAIEKQNINVIDSKADVAIVLGLLTRMDGIETKMNKLAKVSDDGALILSATMMVKEAAESQRPYAYEAEVLELLAAKDEKIKEPVAAIVKTANSGVLSKKRLSEEFGVTYDRLLKQQKEEFAKTWKDRLNNKLNEIIKVKRVKKEAPEFEEDQTLEKAKDFVDAGDFAKAVNVIESDQNPNRPADVALKDWLTKAQARADFDQAISKISTHSLALMKVNNIKQETSND